MYNVRWLARLARDGFADMYPAARRAFNNDPTDDRLGTVYGTGQRRAAVLFRLIFLALGGLAVGLAVTPLIPQFPLFDDISWPAVALGIAHAVIFRRFLFRSGKARAGDFPWLAASLGPSLLLVAVWSGVTSAMRPVEDGGFVGGLNHALIALTHSIGLCAALIIAVATLCYSRNWGRALTQLCLRLFVFRIMVWVTTLVLLEIGIVGPIVAGVLRGITGLSLPDWFEPLSDALSYAVVMNVIYLGVIGATWTVCRTQYSALLREGHVDVLSAIIELGQAGISQDAVLEHTDARNADATTPAKASNDE
ncbi:MAG: hypothetical protein AAF610_15275 [Pseudomonadota bacterium]